jgi:hypothetical protein
LIGCSMKDCLIAALKWRGWRVHRSIIGLLLDAHLSTVL